MKSFPAFLLIILLILSSCGPQTLKKEDKQVREAMDMMIALDRGFSEYISGYTTGIIPVNAAVEIRFTPEFAASADKNKLSGIFTFDPAIRGKAEWRDNVTLAFVPAKPLDPGQIYKGSLNLGRLGDVDERLKMFPVRIQTLKKDFSVIVKNLEYSAEEENYNISGEIIASDYVDPSEVESYLGAKLDKKTLQLRWEHSPADNVHRFVIEKISQAETEQELLISWDGNPWGVRQKASSAVRIPKKNDFSIQKINVIAGEPPRIEIVFSESPDPTQDTEGLIWLSPAVETAVQVNSNIISIFPAGSPEGKFELTIESALRSSKGISLGTSRREAVEFASLLPAVKSTGKGVILPVTGNLVFPFMAVNLKAVDLKIIKIFENNLPYFLQDNELNDGGYIKRFGRPVYSGRIDLLTGSETSAGNWKMHTIDLSEYIAVEPGILYKVQLGIRKSYSLYSCNTESGPSKFEQLLDQSQESMREWWEDSENYYGDFESSLFYSTGYDWRSRGDPCSESYYSPEKTISRNLLASSLGLMAKMGEDRKLIVFVNDIRTTDPVSEASVEVFDFQMQLLNKASTSQNGTVSIECPSKPFLIIAKKGSDRNYLKTSDGSSLSLSSFDVSGVKPEKGIKAFIYGERDVWRPGDSIFLSVLIRDMKKELPEGHPVHFEMVNPQGQRTDFQVHNLSASGLAVFRTRTGDDAITGNYNATIRVGGASFTKRVRIETVKPNRIRIDLEFPSGILGGAGLAERAAMNAKWLSGAAAGNLKASVDVLLRPAKTTFEKYFQYTFDDPATTFSSTTTNIFEGYTDAVGNASVSYTPPAGINAPGMLNALFTARVFEKGGDASIIQKSCRFAPYSHFAGISFPGLKEKERILYTDTGNEIRIVTVDKNGNPVSSSVEVNIYKISYRWWWESDHEDIGYYISGHNYRPVITKRISTEGGQGSLSFTIPKNDWGRYLVRATAASGHSTGRIILVDWPWGYGSKSSAEGATVLTVNTDREKYNTGDNIQLSFPSPVNSRAIVTLENATGITEQLLVNTSGTNTVVNIRAKPEMAPNVYAYVTLIQPHGQTSNDMPVRLYGVTPVMVEDAGTHLNPEIAMPDEIRSQKDFEVKVSEEKGRPMNYTLAIVDEGLLDITGFRTPDPWNYFYAREALGVKTWDLYDYVLGAMGGTLDRALATGGDEAITDQATARAKRFLPVVKFLGPFSLDAGKTNRHNITLPQYTGSVKTMVIAGNETAFGFADRQVPVRDPLMMLATAPRVLSPGEKVILPLTIFVQKDNIRNVSVEVSGNDLVSFAEKRKEILFTGQGEKDTGFEFTVTDKTGKAQIEVRASGGGESARCNLEIDVRSPNPMETRSEIRILSPGEKYEQAFRPFGIKGTSSASVEISSMPSINLSEKLGWLISYPHGCSEQITSALFPQLYISRLAPGNEELSAKSASNINSGINTLMGRQMINGGITLWPGAYQPDNWITSYIGHFILEAEKLGFSIPSSFRQKLLRYQKNTAQSWRYDNNYRFTANDQAYRLFTLALAGQPERGAMNRLRETPGLPALARWLLAAAFAESGRTEVAEDLVDVRSHDIEPEYYHYYYGSLLRDRTVILYTLTILKKYEEALPLLKEICSEINSSDGWYSTQTIGWGLYAYMKFAGLSASGEKRIARVAMNFNGEKKEISAAPGMVGTGNLGIRDESNTLTLENITSDPLYVTFTEKGIPMKSDRMKEDRGLALNARYLGMDLKPLDERSLEQGTDFCMVMEVTNNTFRSIDNIALTSMVPSGWEIQNTRLFDASSQIKESSFTYRDFRDDRVNTYFSLDRGEKKTFCIILNASYKGSFFQPALWCEAMYTANAYARIPGKQVEVTGRRLE